MNWLVLRQLFILLPFLAFMIFGFQNCSQDNSETSASYASSNHLNAIIIDMTFSGGPGIYEGSEVKLTSQISSEKYFLQWYFQATNQTFGFPIQGQNQSDLILPKIELSQAGIYWLGVTNANGELEISNKIEVDIQPSLFKIQPKNKVANENAQVQFVAEVRSDLDVSYTWEWMRPGDSSFMQVPNNDSGIIGARGSVLEIKKAEVNKHVALYRLKVTEKGRSGSEDHIFYSQNVHLTLIKQQLPVSKNNIDFNSEFSLNFNAIGLKRTGGDNISLSSTNDIQWERWDRNSDKFEPFKKGGKIVTGSVATVLNANPRYTKYRAKLLTKFGGVAYSRQTKIVYKATYREPTIKINTIEAWVRYDKDVGGSNKYTLRNRSTVERSLHTLDSTSTSNFKYRWQQKLPSEDHFSWIYIDGSSSEYDENPYREIVNNWRQGYGRVEHRAYIRDKWWVTKYSRPIGIDNRSSGPEVTIRLKAGENVTLKYKTFSHNKTTGAELTETLPVQVVWQEMIGSTWQDMTSSSGTQKVIETNESSAEVRNYRVQFKNTNGVGGNITTDHYFRIERLP